MAKSVVERRVLLVARSAPSGAPPPPAADGVHIYTFFAERVGRRDVVEVEFDPAAKDPHVVALNARIYVARQDAWPNALFKTLGTPRKAMLGEWSWSHPQCGASLKLSEAEVLGAGEARPYRLQIKRLSPSS